MSKRFKVEHKDWYDNSTLYITLHNPPYDKKTILARTKWKEEDVTITEYKEREDG
jgi:hypothetical protein